jgi:hypothetical protein
MASKRSSTGWAHCKKVVSDWPQSELIGLLQELYRLNDTNRRFLDARLLPDRAEQTLDDAKAKLGRMLSSQAIFRGSFRHADVKRFITEFAKGAKDPALIANLLVSDLEYACEAFKEVGDYEPIVDHLYAIVRLLDKHLHELDLEARAPLVERLNELAKAYRSSFGYGISDELVGFAGYWKERT